MLILQYFAEILSNKSEYSAIYTDSSKYGNRSSVPSVVVFWHKDGLLRLPSAKSMIYSNSLIWQDNSNWQKSRFYLNIKIAKFTKNEIEIINLWIPTDIIMRIWEVNRGPITYLIPYLDIYRILYFNMTVWIRKGPCSYGYPRTE